MHTVPDRPEAEAQRAAPAPAGEEWGWYLYGITLDADGLDGASISEGDALEVIASSGLCAVVRRVPLAEFAEDALQAHAGDPAWLETMVRRHNAVLEAVHRTQTVLPAKFGSVYASAEDVQSALADMRETLLTRLAWLDGCDEWGVRLYMDLVILRQRADEEHEGTRRLHEDLATATPGRAYLLQRKLAETQQDGVEHVLDALVSAAYDHLSRRAKAGQITRRLAASRITAEQEHAEVMRAAFLVPRGAADAFLAELRTFTESQTGLWCEYNGPWPPYSFAAQSAEELAHE